MKRSEIRAALEGRLSELDYPFAWENVKYTPVEGTSYLRPTLLPAGGRALGLANTDTELTDGIFQVDIFTEARGGPGAAETIETAVKAKFTRGLILTEGDTKVVIGIPVTDAATESGAWYLLPLLIPYRTLSRG